MWLYEKKLQFPINIKKPDPRMAKLIITQYGGADGELGCPALFKSEIFDAERRNARDLERYRLGGARASGNDRYNVPSAPAGGRLRNAEKMRL